MAIALAPHLSRVGAIGFLPGLLAHCSAALDGIARLEPVPAAPDGRLQTHGLSLLLVALHEPLSDSMSGFCALTRQHPLIPFIVLAENVDANFAAELLKCGAEDFLLAPPLHVALRHKVRRVLGVAAGPAFDSAEFAAFRPRVVDENQRHCFRVCVPPDFALAGTFPGPVDRPLDVKDLSIETEHAPGGMQLSADRSTARRLPFDQWNRRREIDLLVHFPTGAPVTVRARLVPGLRGAPDASIRFAVEYWVSRSLEKERFRRYWAEAQRRMRRFK
jgi:hypothetical protein